MLLGVVSVVLLDGFVIEVLVDGFDGVGIVGVVLGFVFGTVGIVGDVGSEFLGL